MSKPTIAADMPGIWLADTEGGGLEVRLSLKWKEEASPQQRRKSKAARPRKVLARSRPFEEVRGGKMLIPGVTEEDADIVLEELDRAAFKIRSRVYQRRARGPRPEPQVEATAPPPTPKEQPVSKPEMSIEEATERLTRAPQRVAAPPPEVVPTVEEEEPMTPERAEALAEKMRQAKPPTTPTLSDADRAKLAGVKIVGREP